MALNGYSLADAADMIGRDRQTRAQDRMIVERGDNFVVVNKSLRIEVKVPGNVLILEDEFRSAYECKECDGIGTKDIKCLKCEGTGQISASPAESVECGRCDGKGHRVESCEACKGKGALIEMPDQAKSRPTSGVIVSMGPECSIYNLGDRVAYSAYIGNLLPFKGNNRLRVMTEREPFVLLSSVNDAQKENPPEFIDTDNAYVNA